MNNKTKIALLVTGSILVIALLIYFVAGSKSIQKTDTESLKPVNWYESYEEEDRSPYGTYIFFEMVKKFYIDNGSKMLTGPDLEEIEDESLLKPFIIFYITRTVQLDDDEMKDVFQFVEKGNYAFFSAEDFTYFLNELIYEHFTKHTASSSGIRTHFYPEELNPKEQYNQSYYYRGELTAKNWTVLEQKYEEIPYEEEEAEIISEPTEFDIPEPITPDEYGDELYSEDEEYDEDEEIITEEYEEETEPVEEETFEPYSGVVDKTIIGAPVILEMNDQNEAVYVSIPYGKGAFYIHTLPMSFTNINLLKEKNVEHLEKVIACFPEADILWQEIPEYNETSYSGEDGGGADHRSPLEFILSVPSLKWAYYLLIGSLVLYILFKIKRRQRAIPAKPRNENSTMEFAGTISQLYYQQDQHKNLIRHKERLLFNFIRERYFIIANKADDAFIRLLTVKSKVNESNIRELFSAYANAEKSVAVTAEELIHVHQLTEYFYKNCK